MTGSRFRARELTSERLVAAAARRVSDLPHRMAWRFAAAENRARLASYADRHRGQRCFVLGNGPSLAKMDLRALEGEVTFGLNRLYLLFDRLPFRPSYYCAMNELVLQQFADDIASLSMPRFLNWSQRRYFPGADSSTCFLRDRLGVIDFFGADPRHPICSGGTVTYAALQLAYFMGFSQVVLLGVDHAFSHEGTPNRVETRTAPHDTDHCHPDYFPRGVRWQLPDLQRSERAYRMAREAFAADGREVLDATEGGQLDVFRKVSLADVVAT